MELKEMTEGMQLKELRKQRATDKFIIVDVIVNGKIAGWTVTDKQLQRVTEEIFKTAALAFAWAEENVVNGVFVKDKN